LAAAHPLAKCKARAAAFQGRQHCFQRSPGGIAAAGMSKRSGLAGSGWAKVEASTMGCITARAWVGRLPGVDG